jgi:O-succinylbenzoic acid--CoA ligase
MLDMPGGPGFVDALRRAWDAGDAVFAVDHRLPAAAREAAIAAADPTHVDDGEGHVALEGGRPVEAGDALVVTTSGSTGEPRGVVLTRAAVEASARATSAFIGVQPDDHWLACLPLAHVGGLSVVTRALVTGTPVTVLPGFDVEAVTRSAHDGATLVSLVPTAYARIDPALFRVIVLGGSRPPADRPSHVHATYGMTETGSGVVYDGWALDGVEVRIVDGEIHLRCPMLLRCYRDGTDPLDSQGWFATGDIGSIDDDGRLSVAGRRGDMIKSGGEAVWPEAVERALVDCPGIADVAVAGKPDDDWGERVVAYVVPRDLTHVPPLENVRSHVKASLPAYCAPRELVVVDTIPRTALGKVRRHLLPGAPASDPPQAAR